MKWPLLLIFALGAQAQNSDQVRRATMKGSGGPSGKCTIEVRVDVTAEVDISGDSGRLRTLAGQPATWTRMECSGPLPSQMSDFRFKGIDGRGKMQLIQDPRNNRGTAVIHIEDSKGGAEGYTFDIEWSGGSGNGQGGFQTGGGGLPNRGPIRGSNRTISTEQAIDLCRTELRERAQREYGMRNIDITAAGLNNDRRDWISGTFTEGTAMFRRGASPNRFNCEVDFNSGQIRSMELLRGDGSRLQPGGNTSAPGGGFDQNKAFRACQDAVVQRTNRDGYQNVNFQSTELDRSRQESISGRFTASRGPVSDSFDFTCSMDLGAARVKNVDVRRR